jgi:hypothetical protein
LESLVEEPKNKPRNADTKNHDPGSLLRGEARITNRDIIQFSYDTVIQAEEAAAVSAGSLRWLRAIKTGAAHEKSSASSLPSLLANGPFTCRAT